MSVIFLRVLLLKEKLPVVAVAVAVVAVAVAVAVTVPALPICTPGPSVLYVEALHTAISC